MPITPWRSYRAPSEDDTYVVLASRLPLRHHRMVPVMMRLARSIQAQLHEAPGLVGYSLNAQVRRKTLLTLSVWESREDLDAFAEASPHANVMEKMREHVEDSVFTTWEVEGSQLDASWKHAEQRLAMAAAAPRRDADDGSGRDGG